jgi:hypothetical protein
MTVLDLGYETRKLLGGEWRVLYSSKPLDIQGVLNELGGIDAVLIKGDTLAFDPKTKDAADAGVRDLLLINPTSKPHGRMCYVIEKDLGKGFKLKQTLVPIDENDVEDVIKAALFKKL